MGCTISEFWGIFNAILKKTFLRDYKFFLITCRYFQLFQRPARHKIDALRHFALCVSLQRHLV